MTMLAGLPPYVAQQAIDRDGNPIEIAVRPPWPPPDDGSGAPPPFMGQQPPSTYDQLRDPTLVPGGQSQEAKSMGGMWMDALTTPPNQLNGRPSMLDMVTKSPNELRGIPSPPSRPGAFFSADPPHSEASAPGPASAPKPPASAFAQPPGTGGSGAPIQPAGYTPPGAGGELSARFAPPPGGYGYRPGSGEKELRAAYADKDKADQQAFAAGEHAAKVQAGFAQQAASLMEKQRQEQVDFDSNRQQAMDAQYKTYREATDEVAKVNTTVDPNRFWASKGTGAQIAAAIGAAMGAFGAALTGGPNYAQQIIDKAVDRDIDAQKQMAEMQLRKGNQKVADSQTLYGMMRQRFGDDASALAATRAAALEVVQKKLDAAQAGLGSDSQKAQLAQLQAQNKLATASALEQMRSNHEDKSIRWAEINRQRANDYLDFMAKKAAGNAPDKKSLEDVRQVEEKFRNIQQNHAELTGLIKKHGTAENVEPGIKRRMDQLVSAMAVDMAKIKDPNSVVRESEMEGEKANIFQPGFMQRESSAISGLDGFMKMARERRRNAYEARSMKAPEDEDSKDKAVGFTSR